MLSLETNDNWISLCFSDTSTGYILGEGGTLLKTTDGGSNWGMQIVDTNYGFTDIHFPSSNIGFITGKFYLPWPAGVQGIVLKSNDSGINWDSVFSTQGELLSVDFPSVDTGYVAGWWGGMPAAGIIYRTDDCGNSWVGCDGGSAYTMFHSLLFTDDNTGYWVSESSLYKTSNAGESHTVRSFGAGNVINEIYFNEMELGYAVGYNNLSVYYGIILNTLDDGLTWSTQITIPIDYFNSIYFPSSDTGYAVGGNGLIYKTTNGGYPGQSCLPDGITFWNQSAIDNFQTNYPNCTEIWGDVTINGDDITNLNGLNVLTNILGNLWINSNPLTSLTGLENLTSIIGNLIISWDGAHNSIKGLDNLSSIGNDLIIYENDNLTNLSGIDNINASSINNLYICNNDSLSSCEMQSLCEYLASPNGSVNIYSNATGCNTPPEIAAACGMPLPCLPYGNYYFHTQSEIDSFQVNYPECTNLEGSVSIDGSENDITNLNGLDIVTFISGLFINNTILPHLTGLDSVASIGSELSIANNPALINLTGLENVSSIGGDLHIESNELLISFAGLEGLTSIGENLSIYLNDSITSLIGLNNLNSIGGWLDISENNMLTTLSGLEGLNSIVGTLWILNNQNLTTLTGLDNIDAGSITNILIVGNTSLSTCEVQSICDFLASPNGDVWIHTNYIGCNSVEEVEAACGVGIEESAVSSQQSAFNIYPNPSSSTITISTSTTPNKNTFMTIYNISGQAILFRQIMEQQTVVDVSGLSQGIYFVRVSNDRTVMVGKFVKQ